MMALPRKWMVTGAGGFIGAALLRQLVKQKYSLIAHLSAPEQPFISPPVGVQHFQAEIEEHADFEHYLDGVEGVIHLAGPPSVANSFCDPVACVRSHVSGTATLLSAMARKQVKHLVYLSSAEVYGQCEQSPVPETRALRPRSPYGAAKVGAEALIGAQVRSGDLGAIILRPTSVYGPGQATGGLFGQLFKQLEAGESPHIQNPNPVRDFLFVDDLVRAITLAASSTQVRKLSIFNVGTGVGLSILQLAQTLMDLAALPGEVRCEMEVQGSSAAYSDCLVVDVSAIASELHWMAGTALVSGLYQCVNKKLLERLAR